MRVGYLVSQYPATSHTFIRREVRALRRRGIDVHTFSVRAGDVEEGEDDRPRTWTILPVRPADLVRVHAGALVRRPRAYLRTLREALVHRVPGVRALLWALFHFIEAVVLADELERRRIDHLHNHFANGGATVGHLASFLLGLPWSFTLHGVSELDYPAGPLLPRKVKAARFVACVSHFGRAQAMRVTAPDQWPKLRIVRCGVPWDRLRVRVPDESRSGRPLQVLTVGRLSPEKGHVGLVEAFAAVRRRGLDAHLRIGGDGDGRDALLAAIRRHGLEHRVTLLGRLSEDQVRAEMAQADVFALSSFMEGLPVVLMEALAVGVPVVAPAVAGVPELVEPGRTGLLFSPGHFAELGERLLTLGRDADLQHRLGREGRRRVRQQHDVNRAVEPLVDLFLQAEEVLDGADPVGQVGQLFRNAHDHERVAVRATESVRRPQ